MNSAPAAELGAGPVLELRNVTRVFKQGEAVLEILRGISLTIRAGEMVALVGPSGAGKSTLLHIAGLLERPTAGEVLLLGRPCSELADGARSAARLQRLGFIYQYHHLLPEFTALENVVLPQMIAGRSRRVARKRAHELLAGLGLAGRETHRPGKLSGGEQQRVAIARALANGPVLLLADEPTGNLDYATAERVFAQLQSLVRNARIGALVATHNAELANRMDRILRLQDGRVTQMSHA